MNDLCFLLTRVYYLACGFGFAVLGDNSLVICQLNVLLTAFVTKRKA